MRLAVGDLDDDGNPDVVTVGTSLSVLMGNGDGTLRDRVDHPWAATADEVALLDLDHDGDLDVLAGPIDDDYAVLLNEGNGVFEERSRAYTSSSGTMLVADFDRAGTLDLLSGAGAKGYFLSAGLGDGQFDTRRDIVVPDMYATDFELADVNADGWIDALVPNKQTDGVEVLLGVPGGDFTHAASLPVGPKLVGLALARLDSGDSLDLVVATENDGRSAAARNELRILFGNGGASFVEGEPIELPDRPYGVATGDLDGDGLDDVVVTLFFVKSLAAFMNQGDGTFVAAPAIHYAGGVGGVWLHDLDDDGAAELLATAGGVGVVRFGWDAAGGLTEVEAPALPAGASGMSITAIEDVTGDDLPDLVATAWIGATSRIVYYPATEAGDLLGEETLAEDAGSGTLTLADLNGDGLVDLATGPLVRLATPDGGFGETQHYFGNSWKYLFHDLDGDGGLDRIGIAEGALQILMHR